MIAWLRVASALLSTIVLSSAGASEISARSPRVRVARVESRQPVREVRLSGVTRALERATLSFSVSGRIAELPVRLGTHVARGALIGRIESDQLRSAVLESDAALAQANVEWRRAQRERERVERLFEAGAQTRRSVENARIAEEAARLRAVGARAAVDETERQLDEASLLAPFEGTIAEIMVEAGEYAPRGAPIVALSGDRGVEVIFEVPEILVPSVRRGTPISVHFPLSDLGPIATRVYSVTRVGRGPGPLFPAVARLAAFQDLMPGMSAEVVVRWKRPEVLLVPLAAVIGSDAEGVAVYRVRAGRAERVAVSLGELVGDRVSVEGPLDAGDQVLVSGQGSVLDGDPVQVAVPASPESR
ncbi:MAG: efflux RND transporter periplasmic adaptor subunit [Myxococcota bacterium]